MAMSPRLLRPLASGVHPEAAAWRSAVVANGGSVSATTLKAVADFCKAIDGYGLRDRFYRLNLFVGDGLNAALVPLYRGPSRTGTQYGNATDTNVGTFVSGDYSESVGLDGNGTNHLNTGLNANVLPADPHIGIWSDFATASTSNRSLGGFDTFGTANNSFWNIFQNAVGTGGNVRNFTTLAAASPTYTTSGQSHVLMTGNGSHEVYVDGAQEATASNTAWSAPAVPVYIFATRRSGTAADPAFSVISAYSLGDDLTATQAADFYTALAAFQTTMGRT